MFKFLKDKLKGAISKTAEEIEEKAEEQEQEIEVSKEETVEKVHEPVEEKLTEKISEEPKEEKKGFFKRLFKKEKKIEDIPEDELEEVSVSQITKESEPSKEKIEEPKPKKLEVKEVVEEKPIEKEESKIPTIQELTEKKKEEVKEEPGTQTTKESDSSLVEDTLAEEAKKVEVKEEIKEKKEKPKEIIEEPKKTFFGKIKQKIITKKINEQQFEDLFWNLEVILLENNIAVEVIDKIKDDLKENLVNQPIPRGKIITTITSSLKNTIEGLFDVEKIDLLEKAKEKSPLVICFVGINGSGKTTTIAKMAKYFQNNGKSIVLAAADTFRAAAIDQLQQHADNLGIKMIKHDYGSDAAAVAFDAVKHAEAKNIDIVLIDTAGRMHSNVNLMEEIEKLIRVANPDLKIFVGESITGNDCTEQAKKFNESIGLDGIVLSKADIDEKGGAAISISYVTGKPIIFIGTGQEYSDLKEFNPQLIIDSLEL